MRITKVSQQDVFSEYVKNISKYNKKFGSMKKTAAGLVLTSLRVAVKAATEIPTAAKGAANAIKGLDLPTALKNIEFKKYVETLTDTPTPIMKALSECMPQSAYNKLMSDLQTAAEFEGLIQASKGLDSSAGEALLKIESGLNNAAKSDALIEYATKYMPSSAKGGRLGVFENTKSIEQLAKTSEKLGLGQDSLQKIVKNYGFDSLSEYDAFLTGMTRKADEVLTVDEAKSIQKHLSGFDDNLSQARLKKAEEALSAAEEVTSPSAKVVDDGEGLIETQLDMSRKELGLDTVTTTTKQEPSGTQLASRFPEPNPNLSDELIAAAKTGDDNLNELNKTTNKIIDTGTDNPLNDITGIGRQIEEMKGIIEKLNKKNAELVAAARQNSPDSAKLLEELNELQDQAQQAYNISLRSISEGNQNLATQLSKSMQDLKQAVEKSGADAADLAVKQFTEAFNQQSAVVKTALKGSIDEATKTLAKTKDVKLIQKTLDDLKVKMDNFEANLPNKKQLREIVDKSVDSRLKQTEELFKKTIKEMESASPGSVKKALEGLPTGVAEGFGAKLKRWGMYALLGVGGVALLGAIGYAVWGNSGLIPSFQGDAGGVNTQVPPPTVNTKQNAATIVNDIVRGQTYPNSMSPGSANYLDNLIDCLQNKEKYKQGTQSETFRIDFLNTLLDAKAKFAALQTATTSPTTDDAAAHAALVKFSAANDLVTQKAAQWALMVDQRDADMAANSASPAELNQCNGWLQGVYTGSKDVSNNVIAQAFSQDALDKAQMQRGQGGGVGQGTTLSPGGFEDYYRSSGSPDPEFSAPIEIEFNKGKKNIILRFDLNQYGAYPRSGDPERARDEYSEIRDPGSNLHKKIEESFIQKGRIIKDGARYRVFTLARRSTAYIAVKNYVATLGQLEDAAAGELAAGSPGAAVSCLTAGVAFYIREVLEKGAREQYSGGFLGIPLDRFKRRQEIRDGGAFGKATQQMNKADTPTVAKKQKNNQIMKESINKEINGSLTKLSDDFSKSYYKDAVKDPNNNDPFLKEFYKSFGEFHEYKPEANDQKLYNIHEKQDIISDAHPQTAYVADAMGKGGLVENGHEQSEAMQKMFGDRPTANFKGSYARLKEQMKKHGY